jgi:competence protein ComEA
MSLGALLLIVAGVVAWGSWRGRSSVPLDDQLPYLLGVESAAASESPNEPAQGAVEGTDRESEADVAQPTPAAGTGEPADTSPGGHGGAALAIDGPQAAAGSGLERPTSIVVVHVSGAVASAGVVELVDGARVHHAVDAAGGATALADLERVNLAALLVDGERIHVPEVGESDVPQVVAPSRSAELVGDGGAAASDVDQPVAVDVNRASVSELERLPGIGPSIARAILDLRTVRGAYASVDELLLVDGIGPAKLEALRPHAYVTPGG